MCGWECHWAPSIKVSSHLDASLHREGGDESLECGEHLAVVSVRVRRPVDCHDHYPALPSHPERRHAQRVGAEQRVDCGRSGVRWGVWRGRRSTRRGENKARRDVRDDQRQARLLL